jgi:hypothetical protein
VGACFPSQWRLQHQPENHQAGLHVLQAFKDFMDEVGESPNMVVVSTILWDLARLYDHTTYMTDFPIFPPFIVESWMKDVGSMLSFIEVWQP